MPNSINVEKRHRQNLKRHSRNHSEKSRIRTSIKAFESALAKKDKPAALSAFGDFVKLIDTAAGRGVYHRNTVARKKSRLHKKLSVLE